VALSARAGVVDIEDQTLAQIGANAEVQPGGNVSVLASGETKVVNVVGQAAAVGGAGAVGVAGAVSVWTLGGTFLRHHSGRNPDLTQIRSRCSTTRPLRLLAMRIAKPTEQMCWIYWGRTSPRLTR
jgi:hypothetical protein